VVNLTRADLAHLRKGLTRPLAKPKERDPQMAPSRGLTPTITGPGRRTYWHFEAKGVAVACWDDARERALVEWITYDEWKRRCAVVVRL
jgi:hypothetical protein